jgi:hypothetical protein
VPCDGMRMLPCIHCSSLHSARVSANILQVLVKAMKMPRFPDVPILPGLVKSKGEKSKETRAAFPFSFGCICFMQYQWWLVLLVWSGAGLSVPPSPRLWSRHGVSFHHNMKSCSWTCLVIAKLLLLCGFSDMCWFCN